MVDTTVAVGKLKHLPPITALFYLTVNLPRRRKIQGGVNLFLMSIIVQVNGNG